MKIWVDADACPVVIKEILFKAAVRTKLPMTLVANHSLRIPKSPYIDFVQVEAGDDVADNEIVKNLNEGDVVITADIPMAAEVIEAGAHCLNPRGELYSADDIQAHLTMRDFYETLRGSGIETGGPPPIGQSDRKAFANQLDRLLTKLMKG